MKYNKRLISWIFISLFYSLSTYATINPLYKECSQRGYGIEGEYCVFPDSTKCLLDDFNNGLCGKNWMTDDYCIPEGNYVWDAGRCCEGLVAYLPEGMAGQATCQPKKEVAIKKTFLDSFWGIATIALALAALLFFLRRKSKKNE